MSQDQWRETTWHGGWPTRSGYSPPPLLTAPVTCDIIHILNFIKSRAKFQSKLPSTTSCSHNIQSNTTINRSFGRTQNHNNPFWQFGKTTNPPFSYNWGKSVSQLQQKRNFSDSHHPKHWNWATKGDFSKYQIAPRINRIQTIQFKGNKTTTKCTQRSDQNIQQLRPRNHHKQREPNRLPCPDRVDGYIGTGRRNHKIHCACRSRSPALPAAPGTTSTDLRRRRRPIRTATWILQCNQRIKFPHPSPKLDPNETETTPKCKWEV